MSLFELSTEAGELLRTISLFSGDAKLVLLLLAEETPLLTYC